MSKVGSVIPESDRTKRKLVQTSAGSGLAHQADVVADRRDEAAYGKAVPRRCVIAQRSSLDCEISAAPNPDKFANQVTEHVAESPCRFARLIEVVLRVLQ